MCIRDSFCAGAVMHQTEKNYIYELDGLGFEMPVTFIALFISGLSLMGMPLFAGFVSKWNIVHALLEHESMMGYISVLVLLYSGLMTGIYTVSYTHLDVYKRQDLYAEPEAWIASNQRDSGRPGGTDG